MQPEIDVLGISIKTFGIMFALGFLAAGAVLARRLRGQGRPGGWAYEVIFFGLIGGLVGSRLYYLFQHPGQFRDDPLGSAFGGTGLVWYGGAIGGAIAVCLWARRRGMFDVRLLDLCAPALALGYAIGRIGCQVSGDGDYGKASDLPWAMGYPDGAVPTPPGLEVHPTPVYETIATALLAWVLWRRRDRYRPGVLFALYLVFAGLERFLVEFLRRNEQIFARLTAPQLESPARVIAG